MQIAAGEENADLTHVRLQVETAQGPGRFGVSAYPWDGMIYLLEGQMIEFFPLYLYTH